MRLLSFTTFLGLTTAQFDSQTSEEFNFPDTDQQSGLSYSRNDLERVAIQLNKVRKQEENLEMNENFRFDTMMAHAILERMEKNQSVPLSVVYTVDKLFHNLPENKNINGPGGRTINKNICKNEKCEVPLTLSGIWGYGCWCNFGYNLLEGQGRPVNEYDEICKKMQLCLRCAKIDGVEDNYKCNPKTQDYNADFGWMPKNEAILSDCTTNNENDVCAQHVCTCELALINDLLNVMWSGVVFDDSYKHDNGWSPDEPGRCEKSATGDGQLKSCCGYYPERSPYGGDIECCEESQQRFNPYIHQCCGSMGVYGIGVGCA